MRPLRWKSRYETGETETNRRKRAFIDCLNGLIVATGQREHCNEMDEFMGRNGTEAERLLRERAIDHDFSGGFARRLLASLPLNTYGSTSCRQCGLCDLSQKKVAEHLKAPAECLLKRGHDPHSP